MQLDDRSKAIVESKKDSVALSMFLLEDNPGLIKCGDNIYLYNGKCYDLIGPEEIESMFHKFIIDYGITICWSKRRDVVASVFAYNKLPKVEKMNDYPNLLNLNNCILDIYTKEVIEHSHKYYFDSFVNIDYKPEDRSCPNFINYLSGVFNGRKDTMTNIIRLGGYLLDTSCAAEKMFLFDGRGSNGKSVLINAFQMFFAEDQITPLSLDKLASDSFSKELLIRSRVNFCAEQKKGFLDAEELKKIITCDKMEINRKFKIAVSFTPKCKIISASNGLPTFKDNSYAIYRRILIIPFPNQYVSETELSKIKNPERCRVFLKDKTISDKLKEERSAMLNLFIEGLIELRNNNYEFVESADSVGAMEDYKRESDTVREFLEDNYEETDNENEFVTLRDIYEHYKSWYHYNVQESGVVKFRINEMGRRVRDIFGVEDAGRKMLFNKEMKSTVKETMYPVRLIPSDIIPVEQVFDEEEADKLGLNF